MFKHAENTMTANPKSLDFSPRSEFLVATTIVWRLFQEPGWQVMSIRDNGVGIKADDLSHIFEIFFQGEMATNVQHGGLGIGLPVVKNLLDLHGATIEAHSDGEGAGAEFLVRIPAPDR